MDSSLPIFLLPAGIFIIAGVRMVRKQKQWAGDAAKAQGITEAITVFNSLGCFFSVCFICAGFKDEDFDYRYDIDQYLILFCVFFSLPVLLIFWGKFRRSPYTFITFLICWIIGFNYWIKISFIE